MPADSPQEKLRLDSSAFARRNSLALPATLPFQTWQRIGMQIRVLSDSSAWWLGDWLLYGQKRYPDRYKQAVGETSLDYQTLRNYAWVARSLPVSRRRDKLSFQHHAEVAALPDAEQDLWLDRAEIFGWSKSELRRRLRACRGAPPEVPVALSKLLKVSVALECEQRWRMAAEFANSTLEDWVTLTLDHAANLALEERSQRQPMEQRC
jgi:hypothetical protein